ncbi:MAG: S53 family peptidase [Motilibacteraceae bacterium]
MRLPTTRRAVATAAAALSVAVAPLAAAAPSTASTTSTSSNGNLVFTVHPLTHPAPSVALTGDTASRCLASGLLCYNPADIRKAYDIPATVDGQPAGTGTTIVIVDAFGSPTAQADLDTFSDAFGLPRTTIDVVYPGGKPSFSGSDNQVGWAEETSLDLQWAHAVAPGAKIVLDVAATNYGNVLNNAVQYAVDHHLGDVISMSYGSPESDFRGNNAQVLQGHKIFAAAAARNITAFASAGDSGSDNGAGFGNYAFPADDPNVISVGGTNLFTDGATGEYAGETVWGDYTGCALGCSFGPIGATGGAPSLYTAKQGADVSYNASVYTGVLTYLGFLGGDSGFYIFGGTSAGSPQWAGITAVLDQARGSDLGLFTDRLPQLAAQGALRDVTTGDNETDTFTGGFSATAGTDSPTGYGTPDVGKLISALS